MADMNLIASSGLTLKAVTDAAAKNGMVLEVATRHERAKLLDIAKLAFSSNGDWHLKKANVKHYESTDYQMTLRKLICVVAKMSGELVGYISYQPERRRKTEIYIKEMGVSPKIQKKGIGTFLLGYVVAEALQNGRSGIKLYTTKDKDSKQGYYGKWGFTPVPDDEYADEGYRTDSERPDTNSLLMKGDVKAVGLAIAKRLGV